MNREPTKLAMRIADEHSSSAREPDAGELTLDQLFFFRPVAGWADFRTPIRGYYQCGSGTHPGGGITGGPGRLGALEILRDGG